MKVTFRADDDGIELYVSVEGRTITVEGFLSDGKDAEECVAQALSYVGNRYQVLAYQHEKSGLAPVANRPLWTVDATRCVVLPGGVAHWVESVNHRMPFNRMFYLRSQLADIVQGEKKYRHRESTFESPK